MFLNLMVELEDGSVCQTANKSFNIFLSLGKVAKFKRSDGWIVVGKDKMRNLEKINDYPLIANRRSYF